MTLVAGRYELRRPLGHGGMAVVDLAEDRELGRPVALKRLAENLARDDELRRRFVREARLAARLAHPNVVRVYDVGEEDGRPFIAMEYVDGESLAELLGRRGRLPPGEAVPLALQACRALAAAHAAGLVHRDVKPQNLLLASDGTLKLSDFGIAFGVEGTRLTGVGTVLGTAAYLSPEQARGAEVTAAADVYGLGAVLYELLSGRPPRAIRSVAELGGLAEVPDLREVAPDVPPRLARTVLRCLAVNPGERPASAARLARELAVALPEADTAPLPEPLERRQTEIVARPRPRALRRTPLVAAAAALLCAGGGAAAAVALSGGSGSGTPSRGQTTARVQPVPADTRPAQQAHDLAAWLRRYSG